MRQPRLDFPGTFHHVMWHALPGEQLFRAYNRRHERRGPLMWDRFTSKLVQREDYLLRLIRYIHRNPVKAGLVTIAELTAVRQ